MKSEKPIKWLTIIKTLVLFMAAFFLLTPQLIYWYGESKIPYELIPITRQISNDEIRNIWTENGGNSTEIKLETISSYSYLFQFFKTSLFGEIIQLPPSYKIQTNSAGHLLRRSHLGIRGLDWHIAYFSATIWVSQHMSQKEIFQSYPVKKVRSDTQQSIGTH